MSTAAAPAAASAAPAAVEGHLCDGVAPAQVDISEAALDPAYWNRVGLRDRKKLETFRALQSAARRLVGEHGLSGVTVEEIAAAANVSSRTFFNYFDSKESAVVDAEPDDPARLAAALDARPADEPPLESLRAAVVGEFARMAPRFRELAALMQANPTLIQRESAAFAAFHEVIVAWATRRLGVDARSSSYPVLLAGITQFLTRFVATTCGPDGELDGVDMADEVFDALGTGLTVVQPGPSHAIADAGRAGTPRQVVC